MVDIVILVIQVFFSFTVIWMFAWMYYECVLVPLFKNRREDKMKKMKEEYARNHEMKW